MVTRDVAGYKSESESMVNDTLSANYYQIWGNYTNLITITVPVKMLITITDIQLCCNHNRFSSSNRAV